MISQLLRRRRNPRETGQPAPVETLELDFPACIARKFPDIFENAWRAVKEVVLRTKNVNLDELGLHSPALRGFDWEGYLRLSVIRMLHSLDRLKKAGCLSGRILDYGSYFGNFALMLAREGYQVDAVDAYTEYANSLASLVTLLKEAGVKVLDLQVTGRDLQSIAPEAYDAVFCMGVIEHIPHTPREVLESLDRVLKPCGLLVIDTPNLAYLYNRQKLMRGESIFCPVQDQYSTQFPFEGHHREYTVSEVEWLVRRLGHEIVNIETFNYSIYALGHLGGQDLTNYRLMEKDLTSREIILVLSRRQSPRL